MARRESRYPTPQQRLVERDLMPVPTHMRGFEPSCHWHAERGQVPKDENRAQVVEWRSAPLHCDAKVGIGQATWPRLFPYRSRKWQQCAIWESDMTQNWLCPDWRRVNRSENVDVYRSLDKEKVKHQPNGTPIWDMSQPFVREPDGYVTFCRYHMRRGSSSLYLTWRALSDAPHDEVFVEGCMSIHPGHTPSDQVSHRRHQGIHGRRLCRGLGPLADPQFHHCPPTQQNGRLQTIGGGWSFESKSSSDAAEYGEL